jgi:hypothetical protein
MQFLNSTAKIIVDSSVLSCGLTGILAFVALITCDCHYSSISRLAAKHNPKGYCLTVKIRRKLLVISFKKYNLSFAIIFGRLALLVSKCIDKKLSSFQSYQERLRDFSKEDCKLKTTLNNKTSSRVR